MSDDEIPTMNLAALKFQARMMDAIIGMKGSLVQLLMEKGQRWQDWPAYDMVDQLIAEYGEEVGDEDAWPIAGLEGTVTVIEEEDE